MGKKMLWLAVVAMLLGSSLYAQDIGGDWQGTLKADSQELRIIVRIEKGEGGSWKAAMYSIDQGTDAIPITSVALKDSNLKFTVDAIQGTYEGKLSADGTSISGTWTQGTPLPLELRRTTKEAEWPIDPTPHKVQFITVDNDVKLEVLDWGGSGRSVVLLTGLGNNAHGYDKFAQKLIGTYHVYGITRRGFGASSVPTTGYSADRLGDDVLTVIDVLKLNRPVLVGHSIGGEELSSIGSRHPEKVAGLIYLDAGYSYAYYDRSRGDLNIDLIELLKKLEQLRQGSMPPDPRPLVQDLLETSLPGFEKDLREMQKDLQTAPASEFNRPASPKRNELSPALEIIAGEQKYTNIPVPILAIYALPHELPQETDDPAARAAQEARDESYTGPQAKAFENGIPTAHVVRLAHANHYVFRSNEADVLREMNAFIATLK